MMNTTPLEFPRAVWVSYAGADQPLVEAIAKYIDEHYRVPDNDIPPFELKAYRRDPQTSKPLRDDKDTGGEPRAGALYHLGPGDKIVSLVEAIATSLRRIVLLSPDYLRSDYCLWELCCCLTWKKPYPPMVILCGFNDFDEIDTYIRDQAKHSGLAGELARVYGKKCCWI